MARPEWCDRCARDQKCANEDCQGNGSCAEKRAIYDSALADVMALPEVKALTEFDWDAIESLSAENAAENDDIAHALLAIRKLCGNPGSTSEGGI